MLSAARKNQIKVLSKKLNINLIDEELIDEALTHPSYNFELNKDNEPDYERLEFLGDSVLRICVSDFLFCKYPDYDEGKLTKIRGFVVSDKFLAEIAENLGIKEYINIGIHEEKDGGRDKESILACSFEAILGAIYKANGFSYVKDFIIKIYSSLNTDVDYIMYKYNAKELLQQYTQGINKDLPQYSIIKETGLAHDKTFEASVTYHGEEIGRGIAKTKKEAERAAAIQALKKLQVCDITGCEVENNG